DLLEKAVGFEGTKELGAKEMYKSIKRFSALPDHLQVWPGHGAGSACGKALGAVPSSTVGYEKIRNWAFQYKHDENGFVKYLLEDQPEPPKYFAMMKKLNKVDRPLLTEVPKLKQLSKEAFKEAYDKGLKIIDTRLKTDFAAGFIPGTLNIQGNNAFATWCGWFLSYDEPFILIADESKHDDLVRKLMRIGLDNITGFVPNVKVWEELGNKLENVKQVNIEEVKQLVEKQTAKVVDLRGVAEYKASHIQGAENVFIGTIEKNLDKISKDEPVVIHCQAGDRSSIGYSILVKHGFKNISNYGGGISEWVNKGNAVVTEKELAEA
ncbi:MAG TPA: rhodanese-like domain-containing protein, partial [Cyclobacteriaceae bacterium]|nr:rhodanese-like domain-containing protein [Cyclobacteriaceae bacterium]